MSSGQASVDELGEFLERSWGERARRLRIGERRFEAALTGAVGLTCLVLALLVPRGASVSIAVIPVMAAYALAFRVHYPMGDTGNLVPTEPLLVAMFALAPVSLVPALVLGSIILATAVGVIRDRGTVERLRCVGGDAAHALGPTGVLLIAGYANARHSSPLIWVLAFAAQIGTDVGFSTVRAWVASGVRTHIQLRVLARIAMVDAALVPLGLLAAVATRSWVWAPIGLAPAVMLLDAARRERSTRIARAHERLVALDRERSRLQLAIRRIGEAFAYNLELDALLGIVTRASVEALDAVSGRASTIQLHPAELQRVATAGELGDAERLLDATEAAAVQAQQIVHRSEGDHCAIAACVGTDELIVGVVTLVRAQPFSSEERSLLEYLCDQAGVAAVNVFRHEDLHRQALTDGLTGLSNHRHLQDQLDRAVTAHHQRGEPVSLILLDIDDFKAFNDRHGHQVGDEVLAAVGRCVQQNSRSADLPARHGGEELAILLPGATLDVAEAVAERLRGDVAALGVVERGGERLSVTVSIGVAELGGPIHTKAALVEAADDALYRAKRRGKNRVALASEDAQLLDQV